MAQQSSISRQPPAFKLMALGSLGTGFATYAVSAIMILYLYEPLHLGGLGLDRITATQIMAVFSSLGYVAGIAGSYAADRLVGLRKPYLYGTLLKIVAIALLAVPRGGRALFFASLALQVVASGVTGQSLNALVGLLYHDRGMMRSTAFTLLYIVSNIGAAGPVITGAVAVRFGYHAGFLVAVFVLLVTTVPYLILNHRYLGDLGAAVPDPLRASERRQLGRRVLVGAGVAAALIGSTLKLGWLTASRFSSAVGILGIFLPVWYLVTIVRSPKVQAAEARHVKAYGLFLVGNSITMLVYGQATGILSLYTLDQVNLNVWGLHLSAASFQTIPAVLAVLFGTVISGVWARLGRRQPSASRKFGLGMLFWGAGPLFMILPLRLFPPSVKVSPLWIVMFYVLIIAGETVTSPIGTALASQVAPAAFVTQMMTVFTLSQAAGSGLSAIAANFYTPGHESGYFLVIGGVAVLWGLVMLLADGRITAGLEG
ncbi:peptide MFS transporter [Lacticaseibacillus hegangensis]|uniref:Peptide MFS transporter n=1 Tax=Lacticaseibacillus hegangensis TaxID=2486010 RepID=A0ABW4CZ65_9LACO|nr:oligopeptide:H+ symporter [Lacticaseibacillus hegangensis]